MQSRKGLWWFILFALVFAWFGKDGQAQPSTPSFRYVSVAPVGTCNVGTQNRYDWITNVEYGCSGAGPTGTWQIVGGGGGGTANQNIRTIGYHFDGGGSALSGTKVFCAPVPSAGTITGWRIDADQSGSATFGVRKVAFGSYTGTAGYSGYTDVTGGGTAPILSSAVTATFANLTSWVTAVTAGDEYCFQLSSPATITWVNVILQYTAN